MQNNTSVCLDLPDLTADVSLGDTEVAKFDLTLELFEQHAGDDVPDGISGRLGYALDLFTEDTAQRIAACFKRLLAAVAVDPDLSLSRIDLLSPRSIDSSSSSATTRRCPMPTTPPCTRWSRNRRPEHRTRRRCSAARMS